MLNSKSHQTGFSIIEIIIIVLILSIGFLTMMQFYRLAISQNLKQQNETQAIHLASAALEVTRQIRDRDWNIIAALANGTSYQLSQVGMPALWQLTAGSETINQFQRQIIFNPVRRNANDDITTAGGDLDDDTRKVEAIISWQENNQNRQINLSTYLTAWTKY